MMKKFLKRASMLVLALALVLSMSTTALAAEDATITFVDANDPATYASGLRIDFKPGSSYTSSDLFGNFKDLMPGDTKTQKVTIQNKAKNCDYVKVWMYVKPHDEKNPLSKNVAAKETLESMKEFLSQLSMTITCGGKQIYQDSPDKAGDLTDRTYLGTVDAYNDIVLNVTLNVPIELDNEFANRVGEMDWVFYVEGYNYVSVTAEKVWDDGGDKYGKRSGSVEVQLYKDGDELGEPVKLNKDNDWKTTWEQLENDGEYTVKEVKVTSGYHVSYKKVDEKANSYTWQVTNSMKLIQTGQLNWPIPVLGSLGVLMLFVGIILLRRKEQADA